MASAWVALLAGDPLTARVEDAEVAAQALQGPLDGAWLLRDYDGRFLYAFEVSDPPGWNGPALGAWRDAADRLGRVSFLALGRHRLRIILDGSAPETIDFVEAETGSWRGKLTGVGAVTLSRGLATPRPAV